MQYKLEGSIISGEVVEKAKEGNKEALIILKNLYLEWFFTSKREDTK